MRRKIRIHVSFVDLLTINPKTYKLYKYILLKLVVLSLCIIYIFFYLIYFFSYIYCLVEYGTSGSVSRQGDVYSYGIILLEMFTNKRPTDDLFNDQLNLHNFVSSALPDRVTEIVDPHFHTQPLKMGKEMECLARVLRIGVLCSKEIPRQRMPITYVANELSDILEWYLSWRSPFSGLVYVRISWVCFLWIKVSFSFDNIREHYNKIGISRWIADGKQYMIISRGIVHIRDRVPRPKSCTC